MPKYQNQESEGFTLDLPCIFIKYRLFCLVRRLKLPTVVACPLRRVWTGGPIELGNDVSRHVFHWSDWASICFKVIRGHERVTLGPNRECQNLGILHSQYQICTAHCVHRLRQCKSQLHCAGADFDRQEEVLVSEMIVLSSKLM